MITQDEAMSRGFRIGWTIYAPTTSDLPGFFIVRPWSVGRRVDVGWPFVLVNEFADGLRVVHAYVGCCCRTLKEARACVDRRCLFMGRHPADDPVIVESWV